MRYARAAFGYWASGADWHEVHADPPRWEEAKPFHVMLREPESLNGSWIPISVLVFAYNSSHAVMRVKASLQECAAKEYPERHNPAGQGGAFALKLLEAAACDKLQWWVEPYDTTLISTKVIWADNGGVLT